MTIDISKIRPGDKVTLVPLEVVDTETAFGVPGILIRGSPDSSNFSAWIGKEDITAHHPAPRELKVGDRVRMGENPPGKVIGIDDGWIYVLWPHHSGAYPFRSCDLTLVEGGE